MDGSTGMEGVGSGIAPVFLTLSSQQAFSLQVGTDVSPEQPLSLLRMEDIMGDIRDRGVVSDFHPVVEQLRACTESEVLIVYDHAQEHGQNFFLLLTHTLGMQHQTQYGGNFLQHKDEDLSDFSDDGSSDEDGLAERRPWVSLGSELEIEATQVKTSRGLLKLSVTRVRREFGAPYKFGDRDAHDGLKDCRPFKDPNYSLSRKVLDSGTQAVPAQNHAASQTTYRRPRAFAVQYVPQTMTPVEVETVTSLPEFLQFLKVAEASTVEIARENELVDLHADELAGLFREENALTSKSDAHLRELQSFTDMVHSKDKEISCIDWDPQNRRVVAVSCTERMSFDQRVDLQTLSSGHEILVWSFADTIHPQAILQSPGDVGCFRYNPANPSLMVGGCISGQVLIWDLSHIQQSIRSPGATSSHGANNLPSLVGMENGGGDEDSTRRLRFSCISSIESSHKRSVSDICWLPRGISVGGDGRISYDSAPDATCKQFVTVAPDGQLLFWDASFQDKPIAEMNLTWAPVFRVSVARADAGGEYGAVNLSVRRAAAPSIIDELLAERETARRKERLGRAVKFSDMDEDVSGGAGDGSGAEAARNLAAVMGGAGAPGSSNSSNNSALEDGSATPVRQDLEFLVTTEDGEVLRAGSTKSRMERRMAWVAVGEDARAHFGVCVDLDLHPFYPEITLSLADWSFKIWKAGVTSPLISSPAASSNVTCARWSRTRPSVFVVGHADGTVALWDLSYRTHEPALLDHVTASSVTSLEFCDPTGQSRRGSHILAVGDAQGTVHIVELPRIYVRPLPQERAFAEAVFSREAERLQSQRSRSSARMVDGQPFSNGLMSTSFPGVVPGVDIGGGMESSGPGADNMASSRNTPRSGRATGRRSTSRIPVESGGSEPAYLDREHYETQENSYIALRDAFLRTISVE